MAPGKTRGETPVHSPQILTFRLYLFYAYGINSQELEKSDD